MFPVEHLIDFAAVTLWLPRVPRELPPDTRGHVLLTRYGPITKYLIKLPKRHEHPFYILVPTLAEALELHDQNLPVVLREFNDPETCRHLRVDQAVICLLYTSPSPRDRS